MVAGTTCANGPGSTRRPDPERVSGLPRAPEVGPRILFVSGGTALRPLCRVLKLHTHNSVHLVTPFDSGGSSARLRETFSMPSVGDLRNRLVSLSDESAPGNPQIYELLSHRLRIDASPGELTARLDAIIDGRDPLIVAVPASVQQFAIRHLGLFRARMPAHFDLRGASIGNLILAGGYLVERELDAVLFLISRLLAVRGTVLPTVEADLHLAARLEDGTRAVGQHVITGKEVPPPTSPIRDLEIVSSLTSPSPVRAEASEKVLDLIRTADLICYPMGSFFTSVVCNLQPARIGAAIAAARCPKVYVPSTGVDPERRGIDTARATEILLQTLRHDAGPETPTEQLLNFVLVDSNAAHYRGDASFGRITRLGAEAAAIDLVSRTEPPAIDPDKLTRALLSLT